MYRPDVTSATTIHAARAGDVAPVCLEDVDPLLDQARQTPDAVQRAQLFLEVARMMDDAQLFIPVAAPIRWSLVSGRAPGFAENPFARHTLVGLAEMGTSRGLR